MRRFSRWKQSDTAPLGAQRSDQMTWLEGIATIKNSGIGGRLTTWSDQMTWLEGIATLTISLSLFPMIVSSDQMTWLEGIATYPDVI